MKLTRELLGQVFDKTFGHCWYCGTGIHPFGDWQVDHQVPRAKQGTDSLENLVPSCRRCNSRKGPRDVEEFRVYLQARLVNKISDVEDFVRDFAVDQPTISQSLVDEICALLYQAASLASNMDITFYAERITAMSVGQDVVVVVETESVS